MSASDDQTHSPTGELVLRAVPRPADINSLGKIFGGWVLSQMDSAGGLFTRDLTGQRLSTVAVESMKFHKPIEVGDEVTCYCSVSRVGRTSLAVLIETYVRKPVVQRIPVLVTSGIFTFVAIDDDGKPTPVTILKK
jgi:acyl-CoA thioesterase YciA